MGNEEKISGGENRPVDTGGQWSQHNRHIHNSQLPPSTPVQVTLNYLAEKTPPTPGTFAADLGCGSGIDTLALLNSGFHVLAIDKDPATIGLLRQSIADDRLSTMVQTFEELTPENLTLPNLAWVNASFALPFCQPESFDLCWQVIQKALPGGGIFSGHFMGPKDTWASRPDMNFHTRESIDRLFTGYQIVWLDETEKDGRTIGGTPKHWHVFSIVSVRAASPLMP